MTEKRYSYSALSTYETCPLKYDLAYVRYIKMPKVYSYDLVKGLIFHDYAEHYRTTEDFSDHRTLLDHSFNHADDVDPSWITRLTIEEKQKIVTACREFKEWWDKKFPLNDSEYKIQRETKLLGSDPFSFTGVLDLRYEDENGIHIVDYKTPKQSNIDWYKAQVELYGHFTQESSEKKVASLSIYFAFAEDIQGNRLKNVPFKSFEKTVNHYKDILTEITGPKRRKDACLNRMCEYCQYRGYKQYCPVSVIAGAKPAV